MQARSRQIVFGLVLATAVPAQQEKAPPRLVPVGNTLVRGGGEVVGCLITPDSARALTCGTQHDLVHWDLAARRPIRKHTKLGGAITILRLHPSEPVALVSLADGTDLRIDLASGERATVTRAELAAWPRPGLDDWFEVGQASPTVTISPNGKHRIEKGHRVPRVPGQRFRGSTWLANDGTAIEAEGATVRLWGLAGDPVEFLEHSGPSQQLQFSPDGNHLAITSLEGTQFLDAAGNDVAHLPGSRLVQPGPAPDEFWLLGEHAMRRWSGTRKDHVGDPIAWPGRQLHLTQPDGLHHVLRPVLVRRGQPWTAEAARMADGTFRPVVLSRPAKPVRPDSLEQYRWLGMPEQPRAFQSAGDATAPMLLTSVVGTGKFTPSEATLWRLGDDGTSTHHVEFGTAGHWLCVANDGARVWVGTHDGTVHLFDGQNLAPLANRRHATPSIAAAVLDQGHLLVVAHDQLLRLDATSLIVVDSVPLPGSRTKIEQIAVSANGRRVAVACGAEVRVFAVE